jgi:hypothetical protein
MIAASKNYYLNRMNRIFFVLIGLGMMLPAFCQRKAFISGTVLDSATQQSLPYTAIQIKGKSNGISTKDDGSFLITCWEGDTLVFTRLGYKPYLKPVFYSEGPIRIFLAEDARLLKEVTIYDDYKIHGLEESIMDLPPDRRVKIRHQSLEPAPNEVATFGPTVTIGLGSKDKQQTKRDEFAKTEVYRSVVNSPEVKKKLMDLYGISEDAFYKKLEKFNKANPEAAYLKNQEEITTMLVQFFAIK